MPIISKAELGALLAHTERNFYLLDVREQEEFEAGHIPTAILAPWHNIVEKTLGLPKKTKLILYCRTNSRAQKAAKLLNNKGFGSVLIYNGGWEDWNT